MADTEITDKGLEHLYGSKIEHLELANARVTEDGVEKLLKTLPLGRAMIRHSDFRDDACRVKQPVSDAYDYLDRARVWSRKNEHEKTIADCDEVLRQAPDCDMAYCLRGLAWYYKGDYAKALADLNAAARLVPRSASITTGPPPAHEGPPTTPHNPECDYYAYSLLAWIQATCPDAKYRDGKKAVENAIKAYRLSAGKHWDYLGTLAVAYAERGEFDEACRWAKEAIDVSLRGKPATEKDRKDLRAMLALFKARRPYREEPNTH